MMIIFSIINFLKCQSQKQDKEKEKIKRNQKMVLSANFTQCSIGIL